MNTNGTGTKTIVFRKGDEYRVRVEEYKDFKNSLFSEVYARAGRAVVSIHNTHKSDCTKTDFNMHDYNNVISFIGARGTGKTSSMISFARALECKKNASNDKDDFWNQSHAEQIHQMNFHQLDIIDPSLFDDNNNILEIVIAKMFAAFGEKLKDEDTKRNYDTKRKLLQHFQTVHENLKTIANERKEVLRGETIEVLEKLASSGNLRENMTQLVESYLHFMGKDNYKDNNYLIIAIDDIDLNVKHAYTMVEQIRRYLIIPHVIILMAAKLEQLSDAIEQQYRRQFSDMLPHTVHHTHYDEKARPYSYQMQLADDPKDMTERYLEKLIPEDRRLYLPQIGQYGLESCLVIETEKKGFYEIDGFSKKDYPEKYKVANLILHLIKTKVGIEFVKPIEGIHSIIPQNLRELHNLAYLLVRMVDKKEDETINKDNFLRFADYFYNNWVPQNTSREVDAIITEFRSKPDDQKNKFIIQTLDQHFNNEDSLINKLHDDEKHDESQAELLRVLDEKNYSFNVSIGDVLFVLDKLSQCNYRDYAAHLIFAVKTAYTLELHRRAFWDENDEAVQKIIGGRLYNEQNVTLIRKTAEGDRRDWFKFKYKKNEAQQDEKICYNF